MGAHAILNINSLPQLSILSEISASIMSDGRILNMARLTFVRCLFDVLEAPSYRTMETLWTNILTTWFPPGDGYILSHQGLRFKLRDTITEGTSFLISMVHMEPQTPPAAEKPSATVVFFVTCEGYLPNTPDEWAMAEQEMADHLRMIYHDEKELFCALGIGSKFRLYRFDLEAPALIRAQEAVADMATPEGRVELEEMLGKVKERADFWYGSTLGPH